MRSGHWPFGGNFQYVKSLRSSDSVISYHAPFGVISRFSQFFFLVLNWHLAARSCVRKVHVITSIASSFLLKSLLLSFELGHSSFVLTSVMLLSPHPPMIVVVFAISATIIYFVVKPLRSNPFAKGMLLTMAKLIAPRPPRWGPPFRRFPSCAGEFDRVSQ